MKFHIQLFYIQLSTLKKKKINLVNGNESYI